MCGRYTLVTPLSELVDVFDVPPPDFQLPPRYNLAPTQDAPVVAVGERGRRMGLLRWGLVPSWAKDVGMGSRLINARSETVHEKPAFRAAFQRRRCLVPADGWYEWRKDDPGAGKKTSKTPFWIHLEGERPFAFAGLWERWESGGAAPLFTFTILTTDAPPEIREIHDRMPALLPREAWGGWLDPETPGEELLSLVRPYSGGDLVARAVSPLVNSPKNDLPACIEPA